MLWVRADLAVLRPPGTARRGAKALRECRAPTRRTVVCRVQTCPELAEENRRNLSRGSQKNKEYILRLWIFGLETPGGKLPITSLPGNSHGHAQLLFSTESCNLPQIKNIHTYPHTFT